MHAALLILTIALIVGTAATIVYRKISKTERTAVETLKYIRLQYQIAVQREFGAAAEEDAEQDALATLDIRRRHGDSGQNPILRGLS